MILSKKSKIVLFIAGFIGAGVGTAILFAPVAFNATANIIIGDNISLLNETRASGDALFANSVLVPSGVFIARLAFTVGLVSTVLYGGFGLKKPIRLPHKA